MIGSYVSDTLVLWLQVAESGWGPSGKLYWGVDKCQWDWDTTVARAAVG